MSKTPGIEVRHLKACRSRSGGRCTCDPTHRVVVWDPVRRTKVTKAFSDAHEAAAWRLDAKRAIRNGDRVPDDRRGSPMVGDTLDELLDGMASGRVQTRKGLRYKPGTIRTYTFAVRDVLKPRLGDLTLQQVRRRDVQRLADDLHAEGLGASNLRNTLDPLRVLFRRAFRDELVTANPCLALELPAMKSAEKAALSGAQVRAMLAALPDQDRALWATAFYAGLRRGELKALRWSDVDLHGDRVIRVRRSWDDVEGEQGTKSDAGMRDVPILGDLLAILAAHGNRVGNDLLFGRDASTPFAPTSVTDRARKAWGWEWVPPRIEAGEDLPGGWSPAGVREPLGWIPLHHARHCAASFMVAAGLDVKSVQTYMGHSDSRITLDLYAHPLPDRLRQDAERMQALLDAA